MSQGGSPDGSQGGSWDRPRDWSQRRPPGRGARALLRVRVGLAYATDGLRWLVEEVLGDLLVAVAACLAVAGVVLAAVWGWRREPWVTLAVGLSVLTYPAFGVRALVGRREPPGRAAGVAAVVVLVVAAVVLEAVASGCGCLG